MLGEQVRIVLSTGRPWIKEHGRHGSQHDGDKRHNRQQCGVSQAGAGLIQALFGKKRATTRATKRPRRFNRSIIITAAAAILLRLVEQMQ